MADLVMLPKEGITVESCLIGTWHKNIGDPVSLNDVLFDYETDKAAFECISTAAGVLLHKFYHEGDEAPVLTPAAIIGEEGEDVSSIISEVSAKPKDDAPVADGESDDEEGAGDAVEGVRDDEIVAGIDDLDPVAAESEEDETVQADTDETDQDSVTAESEESTEEADAVQEDTDEADQEPVTAGSEESTEEAEAVQEDTDETDEQSEELKVSPRARSFASEQGVDLSTVVPTGPAGRIVEADVIAAVNAAPAEDEIAAAAEDIGLLRDAGGDAEGASDGAEGAIGGGEDAGGDEEGEAAQAEAGEIAGAGAKPPYVDEPFTKIRAVIAKTMTASLHRSAQLTHHHSFDATSVLAMRKDFKSSDEALGYNNVSLGDILLYVVSRRLAKHPEINALVADEGIRKYNVVNLGVAVDTSRGLMVPTIFNAEIKSLKEISKELRELAAAAREGRISPDLLQGGTFTVSNLGTTGVEFFTPIINPPQAAILGVCGITQRVRKDENGQLSVYPSMGLSFTYDHRAVDGAPASRFVAELCEDLASFSWKTLAIELEIERGTF